MNEMSATGNKVTDTQVTKQLAANAAAYRYADLPEDVKQMARLALLDNLGCALRGLSEPLSQIMAEEYFGRANGMDAESLLSGGDAAASIADFAVFFAGTSHAIDFDDTMPVSGGHMGTVVVGAVMALAERLQADNQQVLTAIVTGYETGGRIGSLLSGDAYRRGVHTTAAVGVMAAAAAVGNLMQLSARQIENAIGLAATQAGGLKVSFGSMAKPFNAGHAAGSGVRAARLAARGFEATENSVEAEYGVLDVFGGRDEAPAVAAPDQYLIMTNVFKFHAACHLTHVVIEGMSALRDRLELTPAQIDAVTVTVAPICFKTARILEPASGLECKFSFPYVVAAVLHRMDMAADDTYTDAKAADAGLTALRAKVQVETEAELDREVFICRLHVKLTDGTSIDETFDLRENMPSLARQQDMLLDKFAANCARLFAPQPARALGTAIFDAAPESRFAPAAQLPQEAAE